MQAGLSTYINYWNYVIWVTSLNVGWETEQSYFNTDDDLVVLEPKPNQVFFVSKANQLTTTISQHTAIVIICCNMWTVC